MDRRGLCYVRLFFHHNNDSKMKGSPLLESNYVCRLYFPSSSFNRAGRHRHRSFSNRDATTHRHLRICPILDKFWSNRVCLVIKRGVVFTTAISFGGDDRELKMFTAWLKQHKQNFEYETLVGEVWMKKLRTGQTGVSLGPLQCQFLLDGLRHEIARNQKV
jgi:hypothetical protein